MPSSGHRYILGLASNYQVRLGRTTLYPITKTFPKTPEGLAAAIAFRDAQRERRKDLKDRPPVWRCKDGSAGTFYWNFAYKAANGKIRRLTFSESKHGAPLAKELAHKAYDAYLKGQDPRAFREAFDGKPTNALRESLDGHLIGD